MAVPQPDILIPKRVSLTLPAHLYIRGNLYCFRVALPKHLKEGLSRSELRLSLRTSYRHKAKNLARRLYHHLGDILKEKPGLTYLEIRRHLNLYLQRLLEENHSGFSPAQALESDLEPPWHA